MNKFFQKIASGFVWVGKELAAAGTWVPKVIRIVNDAEKDAQSLLPQAVTVFEDVDAVALSAIKDGGSALLSADNLVTAIVAASKVDGLNIAADEAVGVALKSFIQEVTSKNTWTTLMWSMKKLVSDWDEFGASAKAAIAKLEADAASPVGTV